MDYRVRVSSRSRKVRLLLSARDGLTVVVPRGFDARRIPVIVEARSGWIEKHLRRFSEQARAEAERPADPLPRTIDLPALEEIWHVVYLPVEGRRTAVADAVEPGVLVVRGAVADDAACRRALKGWLRLRAAEGLVPLLYRLAAENGFRYERVGIRCQKTRWGSCSARKTISLNCHLLLLPADLVRYVLLHELCHTVCMNHSERFWSLLEGLVPDSQALRRRMRDGWRDLPGWLR